MCSNRAGTSAPPAARRTCPFAERRALSRIGAPCIARRRAAFSPQIGLARPIRAGQALPGGRSGGGRMRDVTRYTGVRSGRGRAAAARGNARAPSDTAMPPTARPARAIQRSIARVQNMRATREWPLHTP
jgi:hypothetical protein